MDEKILEEVLRKLNILLDERNGMKISGNGIICENTKKLLEICDKQQKFLYFMEARQTKMLKVLCKIAGMSPEEINDLERQK